MIYKRSPIFYMGNKFRLLKQLIPLFPSRCKTFIDAFGGSGVISMNYQGEDRTIYNEINTNIVNLIKMIIDNKPQDLNEYFTNQIKKYKLETSSISHEDRKSRVGYKRREDSYNLLREQYNSSENKDYKDLFLLMCYSINNLLRFNKNNKFNVPVGNSCYNENNYKQIVNMHKCLKNVQILNNNIFDFNFDILKKEDFVYFDPPYLNTKALYNEKRDKNKWDIDYDFKLFDILEYLDSKGVKWGMSNVFENRGIINEHLIKWCEEKKWKVHHLNINYHPFSTQKSNCDEVYICNYDNDICDGQISIFD